MTIRLDLRLERPGFRLEADLELPGRGVSAFFGPSGCGKTSLLRSIAGLEPSVTGSLRVGTEQWQGRGEGKGKGLFLPPHRRRLGYVFQEPGLFPHLSVQGNLHYGLRRVPAKERRVSLERAVSLLGIGPLMDRRPETLSGGEQQRVAIARALATSPALLLLDEPLAALDASRKAEVLPYLESLHRELDIPLLYVSHSRNEVARLADHLVLLRNGRVEAQGPVGELFTRLDLGLARGPEAETLIHARVSGQDPAYGLTHLDFAGGRFIVAATGLPEHQPVRLQVLAKDVSITLAQPNATSILNCFPATVESLAHDDRARTRVRLLVAGVPLLAQVTRKSAVELGLEPGKGVYVQVKSVALLA